MLFVFFDGFLPLFPWFASLILSFMTGEPCVLSSWNLPRLQDMAIYACTLKENRPASVWDSGGFNLFFVIQRVGI